MRTASVSSRASRSAALVALAALATPVAALADDPSCAASTTRSRLNFAGRGPVDFGPGFTGELGSSSLGLRYNFLLLGDYDWAMPGNLDLRWPPAFTATATGDPGGGHLIVQYGMRLQFWLRLLGSEFMIQIPMWAGVDRSERGMSMFTPWAWDPAPTAVTVTAHERLLRADSLTTSFGTVNYWIYGAYDLTTTVRTIEIAFPQAMTSITAMTPEARVVATSNGDAELPTSWRGALRYVGSLRLRFEVDYPVPGLGIRRRDSFSPDGIPFASRTEQQVSVDRNVHLSLPGAEVTPGFELNLGRVRQGLSGREVVTIRNPGTATMAVTPVAPADAHFTVATDPLCIPGGGSRQLSVRFVPDRAGMYSSELVLRTTAPSAPEVHLRLVAETPDTSSPDASTPPADAPGQDAAVADAPAPVDDGPLPTDDVGEVDAGSNVLESGPACDCEVLGGARASGSSRGLAAIAVLAMSALRRRARREGPSRYRTCDDTPADG